jgi:hypothetical protein
VEGGEFIEHGFAISFNIVIASEAKQSMAQQGSKKEWIASLRSQ